MGGGAMSEQVSASGGMDMGASLGIAGMSDMGSATATAMGAAESAMGAAESAMSTIQGAMGSMGASLDMCVQQCMACESPLSVATASSS